MIRFIFDLFYLFYFVVSTRTPNPNQIQTLKMFKDQGSHRAKEFKPGLGDTNDVVQRHADRAALSKRDKREERLNRFRNKGTLPVITSDDITHLRQHSIDLTHYQYTPTPNIMNYDAIIQLRQRFIDEGSIEATRLVQQFLHTANEKDSNIIINPYLASCMVTLLAHKDLAYVCAAADCLVNITGLANVENIPSIAIILTKTPFLDVVHQHICNIGSPIRIDMWKCVANITLLCQDARNILLQTPIFRSNNNVQPAFVTEFDRQDPATLIILIMCFYGFCAQEESVLNEPFVMSHWRRITHFLYDLFPAPFREEEETPNTLLEPLIQVIEHILYKASDEFAIRLISIEKPLITFLVSLCLRVTKHNRLHVARTLVRFGTLSVPQMEYHHIMREAGCIQIMTNLTQDNNERLQREGIMWISNYASECPQFVEHLLHSGSFDAIISFIKRSPKETLLNISLYALAAACKTCYKNKTTENNAILQNLLIERGWLGLTVSHVGRKGHVNITLTVLNLWIGLLKWNRHVVLPIIEESGGLDRVNELLGDDNPAIYKLASNIDDMIEHDMRMDE